MTEEKELLALPADPAHAGAVADAMARAYRNTVQFYVRDYKMPVDQALARAGEPVEQSYVDQIMETPARRLTWKELGLLCAHDPKLFDQKWEAIKQEALANVQSGDDGADALSQGGPWERALFYATFYELFREWEPKTGIERNLLNQMAQAYTQMSRWQRIQTNWLDYHYWDGEEQEEPAKKLPRLSVAESVEQAGAMVERYNRIFLRTLRALRDLRRYSQPVIVQNAGQVNVGGQQINVANTDNNPASADAENARRLPLP